MKSVRDTAALLGVSEQRVRVLLVTGQLSGQKIGETWAVDEDSIARMMDSASTPEHSRTGEPHPDMPNVEEAHQLYDSCKRVLSGCFSSAFLNQARTDQEERFWVAVATFFLQERTRELVDEGTF